MATFAELAETAERVRAESKRTEKARVLGAYLAALSDEDLVLAARSFAGYVFPLRDQRTTKVGFAAALNAIAAVAGVEADRIRSRVVALGDLGDAAGEAFAASERTRGRAPSLTLAAVAARFGQLAETAGTKKKAALLEGLLALATPLEAKYLVKLLGGDLRIGLKEGAVEDAIARLYGDPVGAVQWTNMLTGDVGETALLARRAELGSARLRLFHPIKFMLATPAADLDDVSRQMPEEFAVEDKYDGIRAQAHVARARPSDEHVHGVVAGDARVALFSRTLDEITTSYPDLVESLAPLAADLAGEGAGLILDGEIVPMRDGRLLPFLELQKRLGRKTISHEIVASVPVAFVAYDVLYAGTEVLVERPFAERRAALERLAFSGAARLAPSRRFGEVAALDDEFDAARGRGNEGLMVKDPRSPYKPGRRGRDWLKIKRALATLDVVVTAVEVGNGRRANVLSDYTFAVRASESDPTLLNIGKAYSGLTDREIADLSVWFREHTLQQFAHGKVRVVEPRVVIEVTFDLVQESKRHKSGYALRFPRILRVRDDKSSEEIDTLETVRRLAAGDGAR